MNVTSSDQFNVTAQNATLATTELLIQSVANESVTSSPSYLDADVTLYNDTYVAETGTISTAGDATNRTFSSLVQLFQSDVTTSIQSTDGYMTTEATSSELMKTGATTEQDGGGMVRFLASTALSPADVLTEVASRPGHEFSSMEKWFIATGSVILAVIFLFFLNTLIEYRGVFQKAAKRFKRRNHMAEVEKRCHRDRELIATCGVNDYSEPTSTHIFLKSIFMSRERS